MSVPSQSAVMILPNATLFPHGMLPLHIFEPRYRQMLADSLEAGRVFTIALRAASHPEIERPEKVGGLGMIRASVENSDGTSNLFLQGLSRVEIGDLISEDPYPVFEIRELPDEDSNRMASLALMSRLFELLGGLTDSVDQGTSEASARRQMLGGQLKKLQASDDPAMVSDVLASLVVDNSTQRQKLLETCDVKGRLGMLLEFLQ